MYKPSSVCATGAHWDGAAMKYLPLLALMQSQEDSFHTAAENSPGCDHLAQTTKPLLLFKHFTLLRLE